MSIEKGSRYDEPVKIPTIEEVQLILNCADKLANSTNNEIAAAWERYRPMIYLAADTGMRPQEYLVLPLAGLNKNGVTISQALDRSNRIGPPKTAAGRCCIPTGSEALAMAKHYAENNDSENTDDLVFPTRRGASFQRYNR